MYSSVNTIWVLFGAALVFFMQAGFAMVETGFTRAKNAGNIIMKNLMDFCIGTPVFWQWKVWVNIWQPLPDCSWSWYVAVVFFPLFRESLQTWQVSWQATG